MPSRGDGLSSRGPAARKEADSRRPPTHAGPFTIDPRIGAGKVKRPRLREPLITHLLAQTVWGRDNSPQVSFLRICVDRRNRLGPVGQTAENNARSGHLRQSEPAPIFRKKIAEDE